VPLAAALLVGFVPQLPKVGSNSDLPSSIADKNGPSGIEVIYSITLFALWCFLLEVACCNEMSDLANLSFPFQRH
jgi:hypothetical protein